MTESVRPPDIDTLPSNILSSYLPLVFYTSHPISSLHLTLSPYPHILSPHHLPPFPPLPPPTSPSLPTSPPIPPSSPLLSPPTSLHYRPSSNDVIRYPITHQTMSKTKANVCPFDYPRNKDYAYFINKIT